jgi:hypothetical protein
VATRTGSQVSREQAQTALARLLLQKVRTDTYPSFTQLNILEQTLPPSLHGDYLSILFEKVADERFPSTSMLRRIQRFADQL